MAGKYVGRAALFARSEPPGASRDEQGKHMQKGWILILAIMAAGCATTSDVMDGGNGTYLISAHASAVRGGATGANRIAYEDAQEFCANKRHGLHAIVINASERDVYQSGISGSWNNNGGSFGGASVASGNVNFRFRCGR